MARTIPAPPYVPIQPDLAVPGLNITAGSASLGGRWFDMARNLNLAYATGHAQNLFAQGWSEFQFTFGTVAWTQQCSWAIPELSTDHTTITCSVFASSTTSNGEVRFKSANAGNTSAAIVVNVAPGSEQWFDITLSVSGGFGPGYEVITMETYGNLLIHNVMGKYVDLAPAGNYPATDDALTSGRGDDYVPLDDTEYAGNKPLSSDMGFNITANIEALDTRVKVYHSFTGIEASSTSPNAYPMLLYPHRVVVPIKAGGVTIKVWVLAQNHVSENVYVYVLRHGPSKSGTDDSPANQNEPSLRPRYEQDVLLNAALLEPQDGGQIARIKIPFSNPIVTDWYDAEIFIPDVRQYGAPSYPGFVDLAIVPGIPFGALSTLEVWSVAMWGY